MAASEVVAVAWSAAYAEGGSGKAAAQESVRFKVDRDEGEVSGTNTALEEEEEVGEVEASSSNTHPLERAWNSVPMAIPLAGDRENSPATGGTWAQRKGEKAVKAGREGAVSPLLYVYSPPPPSGVALERALSVPPAEESVGGSQGDRAVVAAANCQEGINPALAVAL